MPKQLLSFLSSHAGDMIEDLRQLVAIESPSDDPAGLTSAIDWIADAFTSGFDQERSTRWFGSPVLERLPGVADHLAVRFGPGPEEGTGEPQILLIGHVDTVWPRGTLGRRPFRIEGDLAYGPGAYDMKGGIVLALWALKALAAAGRRPRRPVTLLFNTDEETGSAASRRHIEAEARRSEAVLVLEPARPDGSVKTWRKGVGHFRLVARGRAAHAGADPEQGVSAVQELATQILRLHEMNDFTTGTTVNVGVIGGGTRSNVVADSAWAEVDVRVKSREEADRITQAIQSLLPELRGATLEVTGGIGRLPMERTEGTLALFRRALEIAAGLGVDLFETGTGGASDGNFTSALGVPTLDGLGVVGEGAHAEDERVHVASMPLRAALLAAMLE